MARQIREQLKVTDVSKGQKIRMLDVLFIGPVMIYASQTAKLNKFERNILLVLGIATIIYNGKNYYETKRNLENEQ